MINVDQLQNLVIIPTLDALRMNSPSAVSLLLGTCAQESEVGSYIAQIKGPAMGIYQMEPATFRDLWANYLPRHSDIEEKIRRDFNGRANNASQMISDLRYATAMCRIHYKRVADPLPDPDDVWGLGHYWKKHYNTEQGAGTVEEFVRNFERYIMGNIS